MLSSLEESNDEVASAWATELERRSREVAEGRVQTTTWEIARTEILKELEQRRDMGDFERLPKKEASRLTDELERLTRLLGGMRGRYRLPEAIFVVDPHREHIAIAEAERTEIPIVAMVDTNCNPDVIDYPIPAYDDAIRAIRLLSGKIAEAVIEGRQEHESAQADADESEAADEAGEKGGVGEFTPREWTEDGRVAAAAGDESGAEAPVDGETAAAAAEPTTATDGATDAAELTTHVNADEEDGAEVPAGVVTGEVAEQDREAASRGGPDATPERTEAQA